MYYTDIAFIYLAVLVFVGRIREPFGRFADCWPYLEWLRPEVEELTILTN